MATPITSQPTGSSLTGSRRVAPCNGRPRRQRDQAEPRNNLRGSNSNRETSSPTSAQDIVLVLESIVPGVATFTTRAHLGRPAEHFYSTLLDFALGAVAQSVLGRGFSYRILSSQVTVANPMQQHIDATLECVARLQMRGPRLIAVTAQVTGVRGHLRAEGRLLAYAPRMENVADDALSGRVDAPKTRTAPLFPTQRTRQ